MAGMKWSVATCWTCLLLSALVAERVLAKGGRGGARGSARGTARGGTGSYRGGGYGGTRSRFRAAGRSSPVRVAAAAAAGAAVALSADNWYASAFRNNRVDDSDDGDYYNRTNYFNAQISGATHNEPFLTQLFSVAIAMVFPKYGFFWESIG